MNLRFLLPRALGSALLSGLLLACDTPDGGTAAAAQELGRASGIQPQVVHPRVIQPRVQPVPATRTPGQAAPGRDTRSGLPFVAVRDLPPEGQRTLNLIRSGGPFPYRKDGVTFGNRERVLPKRPSGGYREYTVPTPGEGDRGARRIVCTAVTPPDAECYYTGNHYSTFRRIRP